MIIFTEHKDTLDYLVKKIAGVLGDPAAVIEIHGGTRREDRLKEQEQFRQSPDVVVLVATDAAGEGVNLQVANLMVNYDLPWNPNRIEQRFGRIHRIGQNEVCHLWNLVAIETREGEVLQRLFAKLEEERKALGGKVFDILGESFDERPLKDLLIEAIRYGDRPEVREKLFKRVEGALDRKHLQGIIDRNALTADVFSQERLSESVPSTMPLWPQLRKRIISRPIRSRRASGGVWPLAGTSTTRVRDDTAVYGAMPSCPTDTLPVLQTNSRIALCSSVATAGSDQHGASFSESDRSTRLP
jgi:superfamily II DNA/RNA helicase